jgi:anti-sigma B factor antagonist
MRAGTHSEESGDAMNLTVIQPDGETPVLRLEGEFDAFESDEVTQTLAQLLADGQPSVVVDLSDMQFANSTTIACFISAQKRSREHGGKIVFAAPRDFFLKTLQTLGLDQVFSIYGSVDEAHASFSS